MNASNTKLSAIQTKVRENIKREREESGVRFEQEQRLVELNELYGVSEESLKSRAALIHSIEDCLDKSIPVSYSITEDVDPTTGKSLGYTQLLKWVTTSFTIGVKETSESGRGHGEPMHTKTLFGPFEIRIKRSFYTPSSAGYLTPNCSLDHAQIGAFQHIDFPTTYSDGHLHPHISRDGEICLGTSKREIMEYMKIGDYAGVIFLTMDVLRSYNPHDPYRRLDYWEPHRHTNKVCTQCNEMLAFCDCARSTVSGKLVEEKFLSECGCTHQECLIHHDRLETSTGINGTTCFPAKNSNRQNTHSINNLNKAITALNTLYGRAR